MIKKEMSCSLRRSGRAAASAYLETFILIGIAAGGSTFVLVAVLPFASAIQGPAVAVEDARIRQGPYLALERLIVVNSGQAPISSFEVSTSQAPSSAAYCYSLYNPTKGVQLGDTCPGKTMDPGSIAIAYSIPPGGAVGIVITITGEAFTVGAQCTVTVTTSAGAQQGVGLQVASA